MPPTLSRSKKVKSKETHTRAKPAAADAPRCGDSDLHSGPDDALALFHPITAAWFRAAFAEATAPQQEGWPAIARGESTLILAPTGTGKTLAAFLWCLDKLMLGRSGDEG